MTNRWWLVLALAGCGNVTAGGGNEGDEPTIASLNPDHGPAIGGIEVTVTGTNLDLDDPAVIVGLVAAPEAHSVSSTELVFTLPPGTEGNIEDVVVANRGGFAVAERTFTYNFAPVVLSISPSRGRSIGGTAVTIIGRGFQADDAGIPEVTIGTTKATNIQIVDDQTLRATTAANAPGDEPFVDLDVAITNANGTARLPEAYSTTAPGLLALDRNQNAVFWIDPATATPRLLSRAAHGLHACVVDAANKLFVVGQNLVNGTSELITLDPFTGDFQVVGALDDAAGTNHRLTSLVLVGSSLFGIETSRNTAQHLLFAVNKTTGRLTAIGQSLPLLRGNGLMAGTVPNTILALDHLANAAGVCPEGSCQLQTVSTSGGLTAGPVIRSSDPNVGEIVHGLVALGGAVFVIERRSPSRLYQINLTNGVLTEVGTMAGTFIRGACATPTSF